ncbi:hypothetical protein G9C98_007162 [Cotesia typhae]|uniref:Uncharacterized protein n=1 Tax=Cotesia typhae TaxID=2053667 RepID=A0A8J5R9G2_9HYME|nr:hypothetical protein G9C98_007162 [Cotesia typhae]
MDHPKPSVQIVVEEVVMEPIENLVQVDEQGFMEYVNRKELRSRRSRSRSRSRSNRRENAPEVRSADVDQKAVDGTQEESLVDNVKVEKLSETKEEIKVVESQQVPKGKSKQKKKQKDKEVKAEGGKVPSEKVEKVDEKPEGQPATVETNKADEKPDVLTAKVESTKSETQPLKVEDKKSEPQNKKGDKSKKSKEQAKKMTEVKKPEDKKPEVKPETAGTQKSEEPTMPVVTPEEKVEPKDQPKIPEEKATKEIQKPEEKKPAVQAKKSGKKEPKKPAAQPEKSTGKPEQQKQPEKQVQKSAEKLEQLKKVEEHVEKLKDKPEQPKKADEEVKKSLDKLEQSEKVEEQVEKLKDKSEPSKKIGEKVQKSENKKPESPKKPVEQKLKETVTTDVKVDDKKKEPEVTSCPMPKEKSKDKKKNKKDEKTPVEVPKKSDEPEIPKTVEISPELPSEPAIKESDPPAQNQSLTSEDSKDSGFCVITSESETAEFTHESSLLRDMVVVPPMDSPSAPPTEPPPQSRSPLPKSKGTSNLMSRNSAFSASLEHCSIEICETPSSKVQFYIDEDDDIVVISHATEEESSPPEIFSKQDRPSPYEVLKFISCDNIWLDKRAYHDAERDFFAEKSSKLKQKVSTIKHSYDPRDDDDKNNDKRRKGPKDPSFDAHSGSSTPKTERLVADLPGGIGSWNDYSTYLSLGQDPSRVDPRDHNPHSQKFSVVPNLSSSLYQTISLPLSSSSFSISTCSNYHLSSSQAHPSIQHLGTEISGSTKQLSSTNDQELPVTTIAVDNDPVHGYKESLESSVENLEVIVSRLEESLSSLPRDSLENMLSALAVILGELRKHDQRSNEIQKELDKVEAVEGEKLIAPVTRLRERIAGLIDQVEQGIAALGKAREIKHQREQQVALYKTFLEETDSWLRNLVLMISQQQSVLSYQTLVSELEARNQRMNELETLPEVSELARSLRAALLETYTRLKQKQQVYETHKSGSTGAFGLFTNYNHRAAVTGHA